MNKYTALILFTFSLIVSAASLHAQRRVTPVNTPATATQSINENKLPADSIDRSKLVQFRDDKGNVILVDTITGTEIVDSTALPVVPPMVYPLVFDASVGVNLWDPLMRAFGQSYGLVGFSVDFNMHNRYIPVFEFGLGKADNTPADNNYTYHSPIAPYFKVGMDYNFLYNSNPDYRIYAGLRYGFTPFKWTLRGVTSTNDYWGEPSEIPFPDLNATAGYLEVLFGLRVRLFNNVSMGWSFRYHKILHESPTTYGRAWYIPGYGSNTSSISASLSVYYTIPFSDRKKGKLPPHTHTDPADTPTLDDGITTVGQQPGAQ